jgi:hypothetical protein
MGAIAWERWKAGKFESLALDAFPGLVRSRPKNAITNVESQMTKE